MVKIGLILLINALAASLMYFSELFAYYAALKIKFQGIVEVVDLFLARRVSAHLAIRLIIAKNLAKGGIVIYVNCLPDSLMTEFMVFVLVALIYVRIVFKNYLILILKFL